MSRSKPLVDRFWPKVAKRGPDECWLWTAAVNEHGYGVIRPEGMRSGATLKAHRVSMMLAGYDVTDVHVLHRCDNPPCVNPAHLFIGDALANVRDMHAKGRGNIGSVNGAAKLTEDAVRGIRQRVAAGVPQKDVCGLFGVGKATVSQIVNRKSWRHVA